MRINLKQAEITTALRQYVAAQGINLSNKTVDVVYTAGRKEGGLTAEINIEDQDIPGFTNGPDQDQVALVPSDIPQAITAAIEDAAVALEEPAAEPEPWAEAVAPAPSLFG